jgi:hypothetical protein
VVVQIGVVVVQCGVRIRGGRKAQKPKNLIAMDNETKRKIEEIANRIAFIKAFAQMCREAPKDRNGNFVVDIVGLDKYEMMFYLYKN